MKRSEINEALRDGAALFAQCGIALPPFADWTAAQWRDDAASQMRARGLGWDVTDYGQGEFDRTGLLLFTARNGEVSALRHGHGMHYAEKMMISRRDQLSPMHRHIHKTEDIVNRAGGDLIVELFAAAPDGTIDLSAQVSLRSDGVERKLNAGGYLCLKPGQSVTLAPGTWHAFWAEGADCVIGEVSTVNDDRTDNIFDPPLPRFPKIEEDAAPWRLLVCDYAEQAAET